jgi:hypothetical protein
VQEMAIISQPAVDKPKWSIVYNKEIKRTLDITLGHAFERSSPVSAVRPIQAGRRSRIPLYLVPLACNLSLSVSSKPSLWERTRLSRLRTGFMIKGCADDEHPNKDQSQKSLFLTATKNKM